MGFLESLKRTFNIGGAEIAVITEDEVYSQGDRVEGKVSIRGAGYETGGSAITLSLLEYWTETRSNGTSTTTVTVHHTHEELALAGAFTLPSQGELEYPFALQLPANARTSTRSTGWKVAVRLDVPNAIDPTGSVRLEVVPGEELLAVVDACEIGLRFEEQERFRSWNRSTQATYFRFKPPKVLEPELDYLAIELQQTEHGGLTGRLIFDLQEKSIGDYFKCLFNLDKEYRDIELSSEQIFLPEGEINQSEITRALTVILQEVIQGRSD